MHCGSPRREKVSEVAQSCQTIRDPMDPIRLLCPWDFPGKNTGMRCHFLLQGIFPTEGLNPGLLHCRQLLYHLSHHAYSKSFGLILWESFHLQNNHFN